MAYSPRNSSGLFGGLVLVIFGFLFLLHNYRGFELSRLFTHWWPLLIIALGLIKLYERSAGARYLQPGAARVTGSEIFLIVIVLAITGIVIGVEEGQKHLPGWGRDLMGNSYPFDLDVAPKTVPADSRITVRGNRGDISVRTGDTNEIRVSGKTNIHSWSESDAQQLAKSVSAEIVQNGDGYEIHPSGIHGNDSRIGVDLDVTVPPKSPVTIRNDKGDISASDIAQPLAINNGNGDVDVRDSGSDVTIDSKHGDIKVSDTKGNVKLEGHGGEVEVVNATGGLTLTGEFYGPIRAEKIAKGLHFVSERTDLTLTQLTGHMEFNSSGNLEIADAPGNLTLRTSKYDIDIENAGGKVDVQNRDASVDVRFSSLPKDDVQIINSNSSISLSLPGSSSFELQADCHSCDITSDFEGLKQTSPQSGDSRLEGRVGSGRGPKIVLRTSYGSISLHKTSSVEPTPAPHATPAPPATPRRPARTAPKSDSDSETDD